MRFLADMGVSLHIAEWLKKNGHDVVHLRDLGMQRAPDADVFDRAAAESRVILTFDLDFGEILALSRSRAVSVVLFRLRNARTPHVLERLGRVIDEDGKSLERGAVVVVQDTRHRTRHLPLGR